MSEIPQVALVTGATSGIGEAVTLALANAGYEVLALGRRESRLESMRHIKNVRPLAIDLRDRETLANALEGEEIDVLVNNAGVMPPIAEFVKTEQSDIDITMEINLNAPIAVTRIVLPGMMTREKGHVFFMGSTAGHMPSPNMAVYGASKAAISSFSAALRCDVSGHGVRVTEIVAGRVETELYHDVLSDCERHNMYSAFAAVQPAEVAQMLLSVLEMPAHADVTRFDILPTAQYVGGGGFSRGGK